MAFGAEPLGLVFLMMSDDFLNNKIQKFIGKFRVEIGLHSQILKPCNLRGLARWIRGRQVMLGL
jgi:hypothetical protein